jgi:uroporphyrinogen decarboxylase
MTHKERILAAVQGKRLDKPCYTAWGPHYNLEDRSAKDLATAMINFQKSNDFDIIKVMPSGMYLAESFGQVIHPITDMDVDAWRNVAEFVINDPKKWLELTPKKIQGNSLAREVECVKRINDYFQGDVPVLPTMFSPWIWMGEMTGGFFRPELVIDHARYHRDYMRKGLEVIEETVQTTMLAMVEAGAAGFFFGFQVGVAEKMGQDLFEEFEKAPSFRVLNAVKDKTYFNMAHICNGTARGTEMFLDFPVHALNWADWSGKHHSLGEMRKLSDKVLMGGIANGNDNRTLRDTGIVQDDFYGEHREDVKAHLRKKVEAAIDQAGDKLVISGGCGFGWNAHHRFPVWHEVMDEIAEARAQGKKY